MQSGLELIRQGEALEDVLARFPAHAPALRPLLEAAARLQQAQAALEARPGFLDASQKRLLERIQAQPPRRAVPWLKIPPRRQTWEPFWIRRYRGAFRLVSLALILFMLLVNFRQLGLAMPTWLPGDAPYPLITALEEARLFFAPSPAQQTRLHTEFARRRLAEIQGLVFEGRYEQIAPAAVDFERHVDAATRLLQRLAQRDPLQAQALAAGLQVALRSQDDLMPLLASFTPAAERAQFEHIRFVVEDGMHSMQQLFLPNGWLPGGALAGRPCPPAALDLPAPAGKQGLPPYRFVGFWPGV